MSDINISVGATVEINVDDSKEKIKKVIADLSKNAVVPVVADTSQAEKSIAQVAKSAQSVGKALADSAESSVQGIKSMAKELTSMAKKGKGLTTEVNKAFPSSTSKTGITGFTPLMKDMKEKLSAMLSDTVMRDMAKATGEALTEDSSTEAKLAAAGKVDKILSALKLVKEIDSISRQAEMFGMETITDKGIAELPAADGKAFKTAKGAASKGLVGWAKNVAAMVESLVNGTVPQEDLTMAVAESRAAAQRNLVSMTEIKSKLRADGVAIPKDQRGGIKNTNNAAGGTEKVNGNQNYRPNSQNTQPIKDTLQQENPPQTEEPMLQPGKKNAKRYVRANTAKNLKRERLLTLHQFDVRDSLSNMDRSEENGTDPGFAFPSFSITKGPAIRNDTGTGFRKNFGSAAMVMNLSDVIGLSTVNTREDSYTPTYEHISTFPVLRNDLTQEKKDRYDLMREKMAQNGVMTPEQYIVSMFSDFNLEQFLDEAPENDYILDPKVKRLMKKKEQVSERIESRIEEMKAKGDFRVSDEFKEEDYRQEAMMQEMFIPNASDVLDVVMKYGQGNWLLGKTGSLEFNQGNMLEYYAKDKNMQKLYMQETGEKKVLMGKFREWLQGSLDVYTTGLFRPAMDEKGKIGINVPYLDDEGKPIQGPVSSMDLSKAIREIFPVTVGASGRWDRHRKRYGGYGWEDQQIPSADNMRTLAGRMSTEEEILANENKIGVDSEFDTKQRAASEKFIEALTLVTAAYLKKSPEDYSEYTEPISGETPATLVIELNKAAKKYAEKPEKYEEEKERLTGLKRKMTKVQDAQTKAINMLMSAADPTIVKDQSREGLLEYFSSQFSEEERNAPDFVNTMEQAVDWFIDARDSSLGMTTTYFEAKVMDDVAMKKAKAILVPGKMSVPKHGKKDLEEKRARLFEKYKNDPSMSNMTDDEIQFRVDAEVEEFEKRAREAEAENANREAYVERLQKAGIDKNRIFRYDDESIIPEYVKEDINKRKESGEEIPDYDYRGKQYGTLESVMGKIEKEIGRELGGTKQSKIKPLKHKVNTEKKAEAVKALKEDLAKMVIEGIKKEDYQYIQNALNIAGKNNIEMTEDPNYVSLEDDIFHFDGKFGSERVDPGNTGSRCDTAPASTEGQGDETNGNADQDVVDKLIAENADLTNRVNDAQAEAAKAREEADAAKKREQEVISAKYKEVTEKIGSEKESIANMEKGVFDGMEKKKTDLFDHDYYDVQDDKFFEMLNKKNGQKEIAKKMDARMKDLQGLLDIMDDSEAYKEMKAEVSKQLEDAKKKKEAATKAEEALGKELEAYEKEKNIPKERELGYEKYAWAVQKTGTGKTPAMVRAEKEKADQAKKEEEQFEEELRILQSVPEKQQELRNRRLLYKENKKNVETALGEAAPAAAESFRGTMPADQMGTYDELKKKEKQAQEDLANARKALEDRKKIYDKQTGMSEGASLDVERWLSREGNKSAPDVIRQKLEGYKSSSEKWDNEMTKLMEAKEDYDQKLEAFNKARQDREAFEDPYKEKQEEKKTDENPPPENPKPVDITKMTQAQKKAQEKNQEIIKQADKVVSDAANDNKATQKKVDNAADAVVNGTGDGKAAAGEKGKKGEKTEPVKTVEPVKSETPKKPAETEKPAQPTQPATSPKKDKETTQPLKAKTPLEARREEVAQVKEKIAREKADVEATYAGVNETLSKQFKEDRDISENVAEDKQGKYEGLIRRRDALVDKLRAAKKELGVMSKGHKLGVETYNQFADNTLSYLDKKGETDKLSNVENRINGYTQKQASMSKLAEKIKAKKKSIDDMIAELNGIDASLDVLEGKSKEVDQKEKEVTKKPEEKAKDENENKEAPVAPPAPPAPPKEPLKDETPKPAVPPKKEEPKKQEKTEEPKAPPKKSAPANKIESDPVKDNTLSPEGARKKLVDQAKEAIQNTRANVEETYAGVQETLDAEFAVDRGFDGKIDDTQKGKYADLEKRRAAIIKNINKSRQELETMNKGQKGSVDAFDKMTGNTMNYLETKGETDKTSNLSARLTAYENSFASMKKRMETIKAKKEELDGMLAELNSIDEAMNEIEGRKDKDKIQVKLPQKKPTEKTNAKKEELKKENEEPPATPPQQQAPTTPTTPAAPVTPATAPVDASAVAAAGTELGTSLSSIQSGAGAATSALEGLDAELKRKPGDIQAVISALNQLNGALGSVGGGTAAGAVDAVVAGAAQAAAGGAGTAAQSAAGIAADAVQNAVSNTVAEISANAAGTNMPTINNPVGGITHMDNTVGGITHMNNPVGGITHMNNPVGGITHMNNPVGGITHMNNPVGGITHMNNPVGGITHMDNTVGGITHMDNPVGGITHMDNTVGGITHMDNPVGGITHMDNPVGGITQKVVEAGKSAAGSGNNQSADMAAESKPVKDSIGKLREKYKGTSGKLKGNRFKEKGAVLGEQTSPNKKKVFLAHSGTSGKMASLANNQVGNGGRSLIAPSIAAFIPGEDQNVFLNKWFTGQGMITALIDPQEVTKDKKAGYATTDSETLMLNNYRGTDILKSRKYRTDEENDMIRFLLQNDPTFLGNYIMDGVSSAEKILFGIDENDRERKQLEEELGKSDEGKKILGEIMAYREESSKKYKEKIVGAINGSRQWYQSASEADKESQRASGYLTKEMEDIFSSGADITDKDIRIFEEGAGADAIAEYKSESALETVLSNEKWFDLYARTNNALSEGYNFNLTKTPLSLKGEQWAGQDFRQVETLFESGLSAYRHYLKSKKGLEENEINNIIDKVREGKDTWADGPTQESKEYDSFIDFVGGMLHREVAAFAALGEDIVLHDANGEIIPIDENDPDFENKVHEAVRENIPMHFSKYYNTKGYVAPTENAMPYLVDAAFGKLRGMEDVVRKMSSTAGTPDLSTDEAKEKKIQASKQYFQARDIIKDAFTPEGAPSDYDALDLDNKGHGYNHSFFNLAMRMTDPEKTEQTLEGYTNAIRGALGKKGEEEQYQDKIQEAAQKMFDIRQGLLTTKTNYAEIKYSRDMPLLNAGAYLIPKIQDDYEKYVQTINSLPDDSLIGIEIENPVTGEKKVTTTREEGINSLTMSKEEFEKSAQEKKKEVEAFVGFLEGNGYDMSRVAYYEEDNTESYNAALEKIQKEHPELGLSVEDFEDGGKTKDSSGDGRPKIVDRFRTGVNTFKRKQPKQEEQAKIEEPLASTPTLSNNLLAPNTDEPKQKKYRTKGRNPLFNISHSGGMKKFRSLAERKAKLALPSMGLGKDGVPIDEVKFFTSRYPVTTLWGIKKYLEDNKDATFNTQDSCSIMWNELGQISVLKAGEKRTEEEQEILESAMQESPIKKEGNQSLFDYLYPKGTSQFDIDAYDRLSILSSQDKLGEIIKDSENILDNYRIRLQRQDAIKYKELLERKYDEGLSGEVARNREYFEKMSDRDKENFLGKDAALYETGDETLDQMAAYMTEEERRKYFAGADIDEDVLGMRRELTRRIYDSKDSDVDPYNRNIIKESITEGSELGSLFGVISVGGSLATPTIKSYDLLKGRYDKNNSITRQRHAEAKRIAALMDEAISGEGDTRKITSEWFNNYLSRKGMTSEEIESFANTNPEIYQQQHMEYLKSLRRAIIGEYINFEPRIQDFNDLDQFLTDENGDYIEGTIDENNDKIARSITANIPQVGSYLYNLKTGSYHIDKIDPGAILRLFTGESGLEELMSVLTAENNVDRNELDFEPLQQIYGGMASSLWDAFGTGKDKDAANVLTNPMDPNGVKGLAFYQSIGDMVMKLANGRTTEQSIRGYTHGIANAFGMTDEMLESYRNGDEGQKKKAAAIDKAAKDLFEIKKRMREFGSAMGEIKSSTNLDLLEAGAYLIPQISQSEEELIEEDIKGLENASIPEIECNSGLSRKDYETDYEFKKAAVMTTDERFQIKKDTPYFIDFLLTNGYDPNRIRYYDPSIEGDYDAKVQEVLSLFPELAVEGPIEEREPIQKTQWTSKNRKNSVFSKEREKRKKEQKAKEERIGKLREKFGSRRYRKLYEPRSSYSYKGYDQLTDEEKALRESASVGDKGFNDYIGDAYYTTSDLEGIMAEMPEEDVRSVFAEAVDGGGFTQEEADQYISDIMSFQGAISEEMSKEGGSSDRKDVAKKLLRTGKWGDLRTFLLTKIEREGDRRKQDSYKRSYQELRKYGNATGMKWFENYLRGQGLSEDEIQSKLKDEGAYFDYMDNLFGSYFDIQRAEGKSVRERFIEKTPEPAPVSTPTPTPEPAPEPVPSEPPAPVLALPAAGESSESLRIEEESQRIKSVQDKFAEDQAKAKADEEKRQAMDARMREVAQKQKEEEARKKAEEEARIKAEAEAKRKAEEEAEAKRKAEEEAKRKAEEEAEAKKKEEEARKKAEEEKQRKAEEEAEAKRKAEEEAKRKAEEEAAAKAKAEEEAKRKEQEEKAKADASSEETPAQPEPSAPAEPSAPSMPEPVKPKEPTTPAAPKESEPVTPAEPEPVKPEENPPVEEPKVDQVAPPVKPEKKRPADITEAKANLDKALEAEQRKQGNVQAAASLREEADARLSAAQEALNASEEELASYEEQRSRKEEDLNAAQQMVAEAESKRSKLLEQRDALSAKKADAIAAVTKAEEEAGIDVSLFDEDENGVANIDKEMESIDQAMAPWQGTLKRYEGKDTDSAKQKAANAKAKMQELQGKKKELSDLKGRRKTDIAVNTRGFKEQFDAVDAKIAGADSELAAAQQEESGIAQEIAGIDQQIEAAKNERDQRMAERDAAQERYDNADKMYGNEKKRGTGLREAQKNYDDLGGDEAWQKLSENKPEQVVESAAPAENKVEETVPQDANAAASESEKLDTALGEVGGGASSATGALKEFDAELQQKVTDIDAVVAALGKLNEALGKVNFNALDSITKGSTDNAEGAGAQPPNGGTPPINNLEERKLALEERKLDIYEKRTQAQLKIQAGRNTNHLTDSLTKFQVIEDRNKLESDRYDRRSRLMSQMTEEQKIRAQNRAQIKREEQGRKKDDLYSSAEQRLKESTAFAKDNHMKQRSPYWRKQYLEAQQDLIAASLDNGDNAEENIKKAMAGLDQLEKNAPQVTTVAQDIGGMWKGMVSGLGLVEVFKKAIGYVKQMAKEVQAIDTAMFSLKKVTHDSDNAYTNYMDNATKRSKEMSVSLTDYINATTSFAKLGYSLDDSTKLGEVAAKFSNVGDEVGGVEDAASLIVSTMKAFGVNADEAAAIADKYNTAGNNYAITSGGAGKIMTRSGAAMQAAGNTIDETLAMGIAMAEVNQDEEKSGTALRAIALRLRGSKAELEADGEDVSGVIESQSKLRKQIKALTAINGEGGVDILDAAGNYKSTYQIMDEIAAVWNSGDFDANSENGAALLELIAGKNRSSDVAGMLNNWDTAQKALVDMENANGSVDREYGVWSESIDAKQNKMKASFQDFSQSIIDSDSVGRLYDALSGLMDLFGGFADQIGGIGMVLSGVMGAVGLKDGSKFNVMGYDAETGAGTGVISKWAQAKKYDKDITKQIDQAELDRQNVMKKWADGTLLLSDVEGIQNEKVRKVVTNVLENPVNESADTFTLFEGMDIEIEAMENFKSENGEKLSLGKGMGNMLKSIGGSLLSGLISSGITAIVSHGVEMIANKIQEYQTRDINKVKKADETAEKWEKYDEETKNAKEYVEDNAEEYMKLLQGVDKATGENRTLSDAEYEKFKSMQSNLASLFPELVTGFDSAGNAIVGMTGSLNDLTQAAQNYEKAQMDQKLTEAQDAMNGAAVALWGGKNVDSLADKAAGYDKAFGSMSDFISAMAEGDVANMEQAGLTMNGVVLASSMWKEGSGIVGARELRKMGADPNYAGNGDLAQYIAAGANDMYGIDSPFAKYLAQRGASDAYISDTSAYEDRDSETYQYGSAFAEDALMYFSSDSAIRKLGEDDRNYLYDFFVGKGVGKQYTYMDYIDETNKAKAAQARGETYEYSEDYTNVQTRLTTIEAQISANRAIANAEAAQYTTQLRDVADVFAYQWQYNEKQKGGIFENNTEYGDIAYQALQSSISTMGLETLQRLFVNADGTVKSVGEGLAEMTTVARNVFDSDTIEAFDKWQTTKSAYMNGEADVSYQDVVDAQQAIVDSVDAADRWFVEGYKIAEPTQAINRLTDSGFGQDAIYGLNYGDLSFISGMSTEDYADFEKYIKGEQSGLMLNLAATGVDVTGGGTDEVAAAIEAYKEPYLKMKKGTYAGVKASMSDVAATVENLDKIGTTVQNGEALDDSTVATAVSEFWDGTTEGYEDALDSYQGLFNKRGQIDAYKVARVKAQKQQEMLEDIQTAWKKEQQTIEEEEKKRGTGEKVDESVIRQARRHQVELEQQKKMVEEWGSGLTMFNAAVESANPTALFNEMAKGITTLTTALQGGATATDDFKAAVEMLFGAGTQYDMKGENAGQAGYVTKSDIEMASDMVNANGEFNMANIASALSDAGLATYDMATGIVEWGAVTQDQFNAAMRIVYGENLSDEFLASAYAGLLDYGKAFGSGEFQKGQYQFTRDYSAIAAATTPTGTEAQTLSEENFKMLRESGLITAQTVKPGANGNYVIDPNGMYQAINAGFNAQIDSEAQTRDKAYKEWKDAEKELNGLKTQDEKYLNDAEKKRMKDLEGITGALENRFLAAANRVANAEQQKRDYNQQSNPIMASVQAMETAVGLVDSVASDFTSKGYFDLNSFMQLTNMGMKPTDLFAQDMGGQWYTDANMQDAVKYNMALAQRAEISEHIKSLQEEWNGMSADDAGRKEIENQIDAWEIMEKGITSAYGALKRFQNAQSSTDADANVTAAKAAADTLESGMETGRWNTDDYDTAFKYFFGGEGTENYENYRWDRSWTNKKLATINSKIYNKDGSLNAKGAMDYFTNLRLMKRDGKGQYTFAEGVDAKKLMDVTGFSADFLYDIFNGANAYTDGSVDNGFSNVLEWLTPFIDKGNNDAYGSMDVGSMSVGSITVGSIDGLPENNDGGNGGEGEVSNVGPAVYQLPTVETGNGGEGSSNASAKATTVPALTLPLKLTSPNAESTLANLTSGIDSLRESASEPITITFNSEGMPVWMQGNGGSGGSGNNEPTKSATPKTYGLGDKLAEEKDNVVRSTAIPRAERTNVFNKDAGKLTGYIPGTVWGKITDGAEEVGKFFTGAYDSVMDFLNNPDAQTVEDKVRNPDSTESNLGTDTIDFAEAEASITAETMNLADGLKKLADIWNSTENKVDENYDLTDKAKGMLNGGAEYEDKLRKAYDTSAERLEGLTFDAYKSKINEGIIELPVDANTEAASASIANLKEAAAQGATMPVTITMNGDLVVSPGGGGTARVDWTKDADINMAFAGGTEAAPRGNALVAELGPEIIVDRKTGTWRVAETPQLTTLNKGDIVFNAEDTRKILSGQGAGYGIENQSSFVNGGVYGGKSYATSDVVLTGTNADGSSYSYTVEVEIEDSATLGGNKKNKNSGPNYEKLIEELERVYDWIVRRLEVLQKKTTKIIDSIGEKIGALAKNATTDAAIKSTEKELKANKAAYKRYMAYFNKVVDTLDLDKKTVKKIKNGAIQIEDLPAEGKRKERIETAANWLAKAEAAKESIASLTQQKLDLARQKLENIFTYYSNQMDRLDAKAQAQQALRELMNATGKEITANDYTSELSAQTGKLATAIAARESYQKQLNALMASGQIKQNSDAWFEAMERLEDLDQTIIDTKTSIAELNDEINNIPLTKLGYALNRLTAMQDGLEGMQSFHESQGTKETADSYIKLIQNGSAEIANLEQQNALLKQQQNGLDKLSEKWQELQEQIESNDNAILNMKSSMEKWNDMIIQLEIDKLTEYKDELQKANDQLAAKKKLTEAMENLEKARTQRTKLIYKEGIGYVYEADREAIKEAQDAYEDAYRESVLTKIDKIIDELEKSKEKDNVYDYDAKELLKNLENFTSSIGGIDTESASKLAQELLESITNRTLSTSIPSTGTTNKWENTITIGDIHLSGVNDVGALADAIIKELPTAIVQKLYQ